MLLRSLANLVARCHAAVKVVSISSTYAASSSPGSKLLALACRTRSASSTSMACACRPETEVRPQCVTPGLTCRFGADWREYKYFILQEGHLLLPAMQQAVHHLQGEHDFRNFCKVCMFSMLPMTTMGPCRCLQA